MIYVSLAFALVVRIVLLCEVDDDDDDGVWVATLQMSAGATGRMTLASVLLARNLGMRGGIRGRRWGDGDASGSHCAEGGARVIWCLYVYEYCE